MMYLGEGGVAVSSVTLSICRQDASGPQGAVELMGEGLELRAATGAKSS